MPLDLPRDTLLSVRLASPVSSHRSRPGDAVEARLLAPVWVDGRLAVKPGATLRGEVTHVRKVGFGVRTETAALRLRFHALELEAGRAVALNAVVAEVENARERTDRQGTIRGVRATAGPGTRITSRLIYLPAWNPYPDFYLLAYKLTFPVFPEPEIMLPRGADLWVRLTESVSLPPVVDEEAAEEWAPAREDPALQELAGLAPVRTLLPKSGREADVVNLLFVAEREELEAAFRQAGWRPADGKSVRAVARTILAVAELRAYETAPMSGMLLLGRPAELEFQKTFNSYEKRHHLRIWPLPAQREGKPVWAAAATHDVAVTLSPWRFRFRHHIDPHIDDERDKIVWDLMFAGCVERWWMAARPAAAGEFVNATGDRMETDGELAVLRLKRCRPDHALLALGAEEFHGKWGNPFTRYFRRHVLVVRNDLIRANLLFGAVDGVKLGWKSLRRPRPPQGRKNVSLRAGRPVAVAEVAAGESALLEEAPPSLPKAGEGAGPAEGAPAEFRIPERAGN